MTPLEQEGVVDDYENKCDGPRRIDEIAKGDMDDQEQESSE